MRLQPGLRYAPRPDGLAVIYESPSNALSVESKRGATVPLFVFCANSLTCSATSILFQLGSSLWDRGVSLFAFRYTPPDCRIWPPSCDGTLSRVREPFLTLGPAYFPATHLTHGRKFNISIDKCQEICYNTPRGPNHSS